jgi:hypothetical protein
MSKIYYGVSRFFDSLQTVFGRLLWFIDVFQLFATKITFFGWLVIALFVIAIAPIYLMCSDVRNDVFGLLMMVSLSCFSVGGLLGYIFGIPKKSNTVKSDKHDNHETNDNLWETNTNLGQVSDWLVKILIGAGLVRINSILSWVEDTSSLLGSCIPQLGGTKFALFIIIYYTTIGFLGIYILTMLHMIPALCNAHKQIKLMRRDMDVSILVEKAIDALNTNSTDPSYNTILAQVSNDIETLLKEYPESRKLVIPLGRIYRRYFHDRNDVSMLNKAITVLLNTYNTRRLHNYKEDKDDADILYNISCYNNILARYYDGVSDNKASEHARSVAWDKIQHSIKLSPKNLTDAKIDPDFEGLTNDEANRRW